MLSSVDCITTMPESEFLVHTAGLQDIEPATNSQRVLERLYNLLAGGGAAHQNMPPTRICNFIMRIL